MQKNMLSEFRERNTEIGITDCVVCSLTKPVLPVNCVIVLEEGPKESTFRCWIK